MDRKCLRAITELQICLCLLQIACLTNFHLRYIRNYHICEGERSALISKRSKRYNEIDTETYLLGEDSVSVDRRHAGCPPSSSFAGWYSPSFNWNKKFQKSHTILWNSRKRLMMPIFGCVSNFNNNFLSGGHFSISHK